MISPYTARKETPKRWSVLSPAGNMVASFLAHESLIHPGVLALAHASELNEVISGVCRQAGITVEQLFENLEKAVGEA